MNHLLAISLFLPVVAGSHHHQAHHDFADRSLQDDSILCRLPNHVAEPLDSEFLVDSTSPPYGNIKNTEFDPLCQGPNNWQCGPIGESPATRIGKTYRTCTFLIDDYWMCNEVWISEDNDRNQLYLQSLVNAERNDNTTFVATVIGGSGCFDGVSGSMRVAYNQSFNFYTYDTSHVDLPNEDQEGLPQPTLLPTTSGAAMLGKANVLFLLVVSNAF